MQLCLRLLKFYESTRSVFEQYKVCFAAIVQYIISAKSNKVEAKNTLNNKSINFEQPIPTILLILSFISFIILTL